MELFIIIILDRTVMFMMSGETYEQNRHFMTADDVCFSDFSSSIYIYCNEAKQRQEDLKQRETDKVNVSTPFFFCI